MSAPRARRLLALAGLALIAAAAALVAGSREPDGEGRVGMSTHLLLGGEPLPAQLARMRVAGVRWIREDFTWARIEPEPGRFDWRETDALMAAAAAEGVRVLAILDYSAPWASSDPGGDTRFPPRDPRRYAAYARAVAERYGEGGSFWDGRPAGGPVLPLAAVELWNEPWGHFFWKPDPDPAAYAALARAAASAVREADAELVILASGDLLQVRRDGRPLPWLEAVLRADPELPELIDGWSVHPSPSPPQRPPVDPGADRRFAFSRVELIRAVAERRAAARPIWITEVGWSTAESPDGVSERRQAQYLETALDRALGDWREFVARVFVYTWDRSSGDPADVEGNYGVRRADGSFKPAWEAIAARAG